MSKRIKTILYYSYTGLSKGEQCTEGFMDYDLLVKKSLQIENGGNLLARGLAVFGETNSDTYYGVIPDLKFTCSGNITGFLLGVDVRRHRDQYPEVFIVEHNTDDTGMYHLEQSEIIKLNPIDFQPNGVYNYTLPNPLPFKAGQFIGFKQTMRKYSRVRFFYQTTSEQKIITVDAPVSNFNIDTSNQFNGTLLLHPITSKVTIKRLQ